MKRDKLFIYVGAILFILLSVVIGIIMYFTTKSGVKIEGNVSKEQNVNSDIGKSIDEMQKTINVSEENTDTKKQENNVPQIKEEKEPEKKVEKVEQTVIEKEEEEKENKKEITFIKPIEGEIICEFAKDNLIYSETLKEWVTHMAIDIKADKTSVIKSVADGIVKSIINDPRYGLTVIISHSDGYETIYSNLLTAEFVVEGEEIEQGQTIGTAGDTASFECNMECHLHFEILKDGEYLDPKIYF